MPADSASASSQRPQPTPLGAALALAERLQTAGIIFVHWKSNSHLAEALAGKTDIDMLALPAQRPALHAALRRSSAAKLVSQPWSRYPDVEDWLILDDDSGEFLHIHLHFAMMTGLRHIKHLRLPWDDAVFSNLTADSGSGWPIPSPEMEFIILLARIWAKMPPLRRLMSPRIPVHIRSELLWLAERSEPERAEQIALTLLPEAESRQIAALAGAPAPADSEIIAVARAVYRPLHITYRMSWNAALARSALLGSRAWITKKLRKLNAPAVTGKTLDGPGFVIAFIGSDGSGKSTVTAEIGRWLKHKLDVHRYYMGSGDGGNRLHDRLRHLMKSVRRKAKHKSIKRAGRLTADDLARPAEAGFLRKIASLPRLLSIRRKLRMIHTARRLAASGSIVVMDRFPQSQVAGIFDGPRLQLGRSFGWAARAEMKAFEHARALQPDIVVKLLVSPETAHRRKPDHSFQTVELKCRIARSLTFPGTKVIELDAEQPLGDVILAAKRAIWEVILAGAPGRPNDSEA
jgi:thymidylate kinase